MKILISNSSGEPIYEQIASQIKSLILKNWIKGGRNSSVYKKFGKRTWNKCNYN